MTYLQRLTAAFLICLAFAVTVPSSIFAQAVVDEAADLWQDEFPLDTEDILGTMDDADDETLSRLVDKSEISDLEFLNTGVAPESIEQLKAMQDHVAALYDRVEPAVVNIQSAMGQGSGVVISSDGYILTAAHVISIPNRSAIVTFPDGSRARAQTLGLFRDLDAGLLKIYELIPEQDDDEDEEEPSEEEKSSEDGDDDDSPEMEEGSEESEEKGSEESEEESDDEDNGGSDDEESEEESNEESETDDETDDESGSDDEDEDEEKPKKERFAVQEDLPSFRYLEIGDSAALNLGQWVVAVGHPGGLDKDRGIVLRIGRINEIVIEPKEDDDSIYVRTDCTLVGGDSGGPLIGMDGSVIGIHSRIGVKLKLNFHVPSNEFLDNWTDLLEPVVHDRDAQMLIGFRSGTNVISSVPKNSLAARNGLKSADRIIRIGENDVYDKLQFEDVMSKLKPYQKVEFEVLRKGKKQVLNVSVGEKRQRGLR